MNKKGKNDNKLESQTRRNLIQAIVTMPVGIASGLTTLTLYNGGIKNRDKNQGENRFADDVQGEIFHSVGCLNRWGKLSYIKITPEIYNGFIFPVLRCEDINNIRFSSTSLVWGHATPGLETSRRSLTEIH